MKKQMQIDTTSPQAESSDTIAMILEIIFGFVGMLGVGWLYAGNFGKAGTSFFGFLAVLIIGVVLITITFGIATLFVIPVNLAIVIISGMRVRDYMRNSGNRGSGLAILAGVVGVALICVSIVILSQL